VQVQSPAEGAPLMTSSKYGVLASPSLTPATETAPMALLPGSKDRRINNWRNTCDISGRMTDRKGA
jgi:hypothetical protein